MAQFLVGLHSLDPLSLPLPELEPIEDPLDSDRSLPAADRGR